MHVPDQDKFQSKVYKANIKSTRNQKFGQYHVTKKVSEKVVSSFKFQFCQAPSQHILLLDKGWEIAKLLVKYKFQKSASVVSIKCEL